MKDIGHIPVSTVRSMMLCVEPQLILLDYYWIEYDSYHVCEFDLDICTGSILKKQNKQTKTIVSRCS